MYRDLRVRTWVLYRVSGSCMHAPESSPPASVSHSVSMILLRCDDGLLLVRKGWEIDLENGTGMHHKKLVADCVCWSLLGVFSRWLPRRRDHHRVTALLLLLIAVVVDSVARVHYRP